ncbi:hypothetical protein BJ684DRAFT_20872 [Piptocephalis cylindrospora]|uniref:Uncharacterized protein n=1 Tax=Piptocephalis cylindrospora TaxID=1907219 RepID=A0A4P9Y183_9FUNG|nr:hypothetical protein BJ684DRAFT_20872 [Piptocephalis cylindrospora]|eukprot:RKP12596.1 hypothetical protein BJ684DRAFT_20872 [Piptocephalis cylindrospora]
MSSQEGSVASRGERASGSTPTNTPPAADDPPSWSELRSRTENIYSPVKDRALDASNRLLVQLDLPPDLLSSTSTLMRDGARRARKDLADTLNLVPTPCALIPLLLIPVFVLFSLFSNGSSCSWVMTFFLVTMVAKVAKKAGRLHPIISLILLTASAFLFPFRWVLLMAYSTVVVGYFRRRYWRHLRCSQCHTSGPTHSPPSRSFYRHHQKRHEQWKQFLDQLFPSQ